MITRFLTDVTAKFNPFSARAKVARIFLSAIPPEARGAMKVSTTILPRTTQENPSLNVTFKDGKKIDFDLEKMMINDVVELVDRHSRMLARKEDLSS